MYSSSNSSTALPSNGASLSRGHENNVKSMKLGQESSVKREMSASKGGVYLRQMGKGGVEGGGLSEQ